MASDNPPSGRLQISHMCYFGGWMGFFCAGSASTRRYLRCQQTAPAICGACGADISCRSPDGLIQDDGTAFSQQILTIRRLCGNRQYSQTARRITSGGKPSVHPNIKLGRKVTMEGNM